MARGDEARAVSAYVLDRLTRECAERGRAAAISRETGIATATITNALKKKRGIGNDVARALGKMWNMSFAALETEALRWAGEHPEALAGDPYPARTQAAQLCRDHGVPEAAIARVLSEPVTADDASRSALWWADRIRYVQIQLLGSGETTPARRLGR